MLNQEIKQNYIYPPKRTEPSHEITENGFLFSSPDGMKKTVEVKKDDLVILLDTALGVDGRWSKIQLQDEVQGYIKTEFLKKLILTLPLANVEVLTPTVTTEGIYAQPWTERKINEVWFDETDYTYYTSYLTNYESTGGGKLEDRLAESFRPALKNILSEQGKVSDDKLLGNLMLRYAFGFVYDYYVNPRPKTKMRILVGIHKKYLDPIEDLSPVTTLDKEDKVRYKVKFEMPLSGLIRKLEELSGYIQGLQPQFDTFSGTIQGLNLQDESAGVLSFGSSLGKFLVDNDVNTEDSHNAIELGLDAEFKIVYVKRVHGADKILLNKGLQELGRSPAGQSSRVMGYIWGIYDILAEKDNQDSLLKFVELHSHPRPKIDLIPYRNISRKAKQAKNIYQSLDRRINERPIKTFNSRFTEDQRLDSSELKREIRTVRKDAEDFVGDEVIKRLPELVEKITDVDEFYQNILNKVDVKSLIQKALMSSLEEVTANEAASSFYQAAVDNLLQKKINNFDLEQQGKIPYEILNNQKTMRLKKEGYDLPVANDLQQIDAIKKDKTRIAQALLASGEERALLLKQMSDSAISFLFELEGGYEIAPMPSYGVDSESILNDDLNAAEYASNATGSLANASFPTPFFVNQNIPSPLTRGLSPVNVPTSELTRALNLLNSGNGITISSPPCTQDPTVKVENNKKTVTLGSPIALPRINLPDTDFIPQLPENIEIPTVSFDDSIPTVDYLSDLTGLLEKTIEQMLLSVIAAPIKKMAASIYNKIPRLQEDDLFGNTPITDLFEPENLKDIYRDLGATPSQVPVVQDMLDEISNMFTTKEVVRLLDGEAPPSAVEEAYMLAKEQYPQLSFMNSDINKFRRFFMDMRPFADPQVIEEIQTQPNFGDPRKEMFCGEDDELLEQSLLEKGDSITQEQIDDQISKKRKRAQKKIKDLASLLADPSAQMSKGILPQECSENAQENSTTGLIPRMPASMQYMYDKMLDSTFEGVYTALNNEINELKQGMVSNIKVTKLVSPNVDIMNPADASLGVVRIKNPAVVQAGVSLKENEEGLFADNTPINIETSESKTVPALQGDYGDILGVSKNFSRSSLGDELKLEIPQDDFTQSPIRTSISLVFPSTTEGEAETNFELRIDSTDPSLAYEAQFTSDVSPQVNQFVRQNYLSNLEQEYQVYSPQSSVFGKYVAELWNQSLGNENNRDIIFGDLRKHYTARVFERITTDIYEQIAVKISESKLLGTTGNTPATPAPGSPDLNISAANTLEVLDFTPEPTDDQLSLGEYPTLISIDQIKSAVKEQFDNDNCSRSPCAASNGQGVDTVDVESSTVDGAVKSITRLYVLQYLMKSMFATTQFESTEAFQDVQFAYVADKMLQDLESMFGGGFRASFVDAAYNMIVKRKIIPMSDDFVSEEQKEKDIKFLVKREYPIVFDNLREVIGPQNSEEIMDVLLKEWIPTIDVPANLNDTQGGRFYSYRQPEVSFEAGTLSQAELQQRANEAREFFGITEGEVIPPEKTQEIINSFFSETLPGEEELVRQFVSKVGLEESDIAALGEDSKRFSISNGQLVLERYIRIVDKQGTEFDKVRDRVAEPGFEATSGYVNIQKWNSWVTQAQLNGTIDWSKPIEDYFESWNLGLRLTYIPPPEGFEEVVSSGGLQEKKSIEDIEGEAPTQTILSGPPLNPPQTVPFPQGYKDILSKTTDNSLFDKLKAFKVRESGQVTETTGVQFYTNELDYQIRDKTSFSRFERDIYPVPLLEIEVELPKEASIDSQRKDIIRKQTIDGYYGLLRDMMKKDVRFKMLFEFCFPVQTYVDVTSIYSQLTVDQNYGTLNSFRNTKEQLKAIFEAAKNSNRYDYEDEQVREGSKNTSKRYNGSSSLPPSPASAMMILVKFIAEQFDLNIAIASKISELTDVPVSAASLAQLPINIFPPFPFGPGIGAPITPVGFAYLANEALMKLIGDATK